MHLPPRAFDTRSGVMPPAGIDQRTRFRKPLLYPLSYGARGRRVAPRPHGDCPAAAIRARAERKGCHVSHALAG